MCSIEQRSADFDTFAYLRLQFGCIIDEEQDLSIPEDLLPTRPHYRHKCEDLKGVNLLLLLLGNTQIVVKKTKSPVDPCVRPFAYHGNHGGQTVVHTDRWSDSSSMTTNPALA